MALLCVSRLERISLPVVSARGAPKIRFANFWGPRKRGPSNHRTSSDYWVPALAPLRFARPGRQAKFVASAIIILSNKLIAVELVDRQFRLDEALLLVEMLQVGEPLRIHGAQRALPLVGALRVVGEDFLHQLLFALERRRRLDINQRGLGRIAHHELHALERGFD